MAKKIKLDLSQFKASGVYTLEFDASESILLTSNTARLVVGFSNIGPFNTPVFIPDVSTALQIFGDIDRSLENKGSFFHRSIFTCLLQGPVYALNLLKLNNEVDENGNPTANADVTEYQSFSIDTEEKNSPKRTELYSSFFNTEKFWYADPKYFLKNRESQDSSKILNFVNLGRQNVSIIIRKSTDANIPLSGFNVFATDWYGAKDLPSFLHPYDYISDYFIDVYAIAGDWTNYNALSVDPTYKTYFNGQGFIKEQLDNFLNLPNVILLQSTTGCLIPYFTDLQGNNQYIQSLINAQTPVSGIFCSVNEFAFDDICSSDYSKIDLVGHHLIDEIGSDSDISGNKELDLLSYKQKLLADNLYTKKSQLVVDAATGPAPTGGQINIGSLIDFNGPSAGYGAPSSYFSAYNSSLTANGLNYLITATGGTSYVQNIVSNLDSTTGTRFILGKVTGLTGATGPVASQFTNGDIVKLKIERVDEIGGQARISFSHPLNTSTYKAAGVSITPYTNLTVASGLPASYQFGKTDYFDIQNIIQNGGTGNFNSYVGYQESGLYSDASSGQLVDSDTIWLSSDGTNLKYLGLTKSQDKDNFNIYIGRTFSNTSLELATQSNCPAFGLAYASNNIGNPVSSNELDIISFTGSINAYYNISSYISENSFEIALIDGASPLSVGDYVVSTDLDICTPSSGNRQSRLTKVVEVSRTTNSGIVKVKTARPVLYYGGNPLRIQKFKSLESFTKTFNFSNLPGFVMSANSKPNGTSSRQDEILDMLYSTNLASTLALKSAITFRYLVDSFEGQIKPNSKHQYSRLAKARAKCLALCNPPSMRQFASSLDPRFTDAPTLSNPSPNLNVRYIPDGGNLSLNPSFTFSLPTEELGAKYVGFFGPYLTSREGNREVNVPTAAYVSNNFTAKFGNGVPYALAAGKKRGVISAPNITGVEYDLSDEDRGYLESFGINPIIRMSGAGVVIYGNSTAYQIVNSAMSLLHVRDILISVETDVEDILGNYVFDFNEDSLRLEIKTLVDNYLDTVKAGGGITTYSTIMDSSNNTPGIFDQNVGIIDIIIEPARAIQKFINRITVTRTGGISSGGFIQFA